MANEGRFLKKFAAGGFEILKDAAALWTKAGRVERLKSSSGAGDDWRNADLGGTDLSVTDLSGRNLSRANLSGALISGANLNGMNLSRANLSGACADNSYLSGANLSGADLVAANLGGAYLSGANLDESNLGGADLSGADLSRANLSMADLSDANLTGANLQSATLINTDFTNADLTGCRVYGVSAWGLKLEGAKQQNLIITPAGEPEITVDNIEVAQFVYLMLNNQKVRDVINTITSKAVLILGRFTDERKAVLDALREELRKRDLLPILFDFAIPASRDVTETIKTLASLARFVIADNRNSFMPPRRCGGGKPCSWKLCRSPAPHVVAHVAGRVPVAIGLSTPE